MASNVEYMRRAIELAELAGRIFCPPRIRGVGTLPLQEIVSNRD
jgi:hypothetical protein